MTSSRVTFSDVITTDDHDADGSFHNIPLQPLASQSTLSRTFKTRTSFMDLNASEDEGNLTDVSSDGSSTFGKGKIPGAQNNKKDSRQQSIATQIFMAPTRLRSGHSYQESMRKRKMSLHGKPIYFTIPSKRKSRNRKAKIAVYNFLERPTFHPWSIVYHVVTFALVFGCLVLSVFATIEEYKVMANRVLYVLEIVILVVFTCELILRMWSSGCRCRYQGIVGILRFSRKPFCIIDIIVVVSSFLVICIGSQGQMFAATAMRSVRFLQILRMVRMDRRGGTWKLLSSVVKAHTKELLTAWYIGFLALIFASFLVFQAEKQENEKDFGNFADALWWGLVTLTTIGYGDKTPKTWIGRLIASCFAILGISFFALPAGILGSGFALKVQEQHRQKHFARRRMPAAYLIQCMWRCYAADKNSRSVATWLPHLRARSDCHSGNKKTLKDILRPTSPKLGRKPTLRSRFSSKLSVVSQPPGLTELAPPVSLGLRNNKAEITKSQSFAEKLSDRLSRQNSIRVPWRDKTVVDKKSPYEAENAEDSDGSSSNGSNGSGFTVLTEQHKNAVRSIRMMKFMVARRKFKEALRPYDVKDVIEQYSSGHVDMLSRIKLLQSRVDMLLGINPENCTSNATSFYRNMQPTHNPAEFQHCRSLNTRLMNVESDLRSLDNKLETILELVSQNGSGPRQRLITGMSSEKSRRGKEMFTSSLRRTPSMQQAASNGGDANITSRKHSFGSGRFARSRFYQSSKHGKSSVNRHQHFHKRQLSPKLTKSAYEMKPASAWGIKSQIDYESPDTENEDNIHSDKDSNKDDCIDFAEDIEENRKKGSSVRSLPSKSRRFGVSHDPFPAKPLVKVLSDVEELLDEKYSPAGSGGDKTSQPTNNKDAWKEDFCCRMPSDGNDTNDYSSCLSSISLQSNENQSSLLTERTVLDSFKASEPTSYASNKSSQHETSDWEMPVTYHSLAVPLLNKPSEKLNDNFMISNEILVDQSECYTLHEKHTQRVSRHEDKQLPMPISPTSKPCLDHTNSVTSKPFGCVVSATDMV
ncbi:potassium voltage-gated channel subfamily KQT member 5-like isoform X3 [Clavelina lepadiformis]|uniref:potassium voltage-gated channel subfamily KQT member 5-like isoform X3 n=2 Tax=Clavelina lepadiformis TaxID=159417 RepID=UPI004042EC00